MIRNSFHLMSPDWLWLILFFTACNTPIAQRHYYEHPSMGTLFKVVVYTKDSNRIQRIVNQAFSQLDSLNLSMSDYIPHSELMRLSRSSGSNQFVRLSEPLWDVIQQSKYWYSWSGGYFDITVGSYTQMWRRARRMGELPDSLKIELAGKGVGMGFIWMNKQDKSVKLSVENMQLDLGGIAKGYAVDHIFNHLKKEGYSSCMVDGGGDIRLGDPPPDKEGWEVLIENFVGQDSIFIVRNKAVATSGDFYRNMEIAGKRYSHIIDPFTGTGITASRSVTVIANDCTSADVLASVFSIVGKANKSLNEKIPDNTDIILFERNGQKVELNQLP